MKKILIPILGLAIVATSCESKLDIPQKGVMSEEEFFADPDAAAEALLANMYASLFGNNGIAGTDGIYNPQMMLLNYSADDVLAAGGDAGDHGDFRVFDEFRYDDANVPLKQLYNGYANSIFTSNLVISNFSDDNGATPKSTSALAKRCVAEARVLRAYMHMAEALAFNTPCIVDHILNSSELPQQAESQQQVLEWVIAECEKAISSGSLPKRNGVNDKDATARMTVGFAQFVAGKAAMFNNDKETARKYLGALIASGDYKLVPSNEYWTIFHAAGDGCSEVIFAPNILEDPAFTSNPWGIGGPIQRGRWMVADVLCWRTDALASVPNVCETLPGGGGGWNGGAIQQDFAEKFLAHDGNSPRRRATFITEDEFLYEMEWASDKNGFAIRDENGDTIEFYSAPLTKEQKAIDPTRGIKNSTGIYSHSKYFEWKNMVYSHAPKLLAGDDADKYPADYLATLGYNSNQGNLTIARYAEALLLYAEACLGSSDEAKGLAALKEIQTRSGSGIVNGSSYTIDDVMEEKQYELWFEGARFQDLVRWSKQYPDKVNLDKIFNGKDANGKTFHDRIPIVTDAYDFAHEGTVQHKLSVSYVQAIYKPFEVGKHEYFPFPQDVKIGNPELKDVLGWAK